MPGGVEQEARGRRKHLDVPGPAEPLVALRAVGRHVQEVAAHAPDDVLVELVQVRIGTFEPAGPPQVGADDDGFGVLGSHVRAGHLGVPEAVEGQARLQHGFFGPGKQIGVGGLGAAQGTHAEFAVFQHFRVAHGHLFGIAYPQPHPADDARRRPPQLHGQPRAAGRGRGTLNRQGRAGG